MNGGRFIEGYSDAGQMFEDTLPKMQRFDMDSGKLENGMEFGAFRNVTVVGELAVMAVKQYIYNTMI
ncbi:hypothetical protein SPFM20_00292 [Salmonella phage SPFM20]|nr:hypothetical protein SPFM8_00290 [Salmonella phage SPFM8]VFR14970.1 hypothetical protein SPFM20_00292 [Salmonella phage SPFM20]